MTLDNDELLEELRRRLKSGELDPLDVQSRLLDDFAINQGPEAPFDNRVAGADVTASRTTLLSLTRLLYIVGALLIGLGIVYFMSQLWSDLSATLRILITLGTGLVFTLAGSLFLILNPDRELGSAFHAVGGLLVPGGALVTLDELFTNVSSTGPVATTMGLVFLFYAVLVFYHRRVVVSFFALATGTCFIYLLSDALLASAGAAYYAYLTMIFGISYVLLAYVSAGSWNHQLMPLLYLAGSAGFFGAAYSRLNSTQLMELLFPFLAFGGLAVAVALLKSRIVLVTSTIAIIGYIVHLTRQYFADSIGWPVALIFLGFIVMGLGYLSINLNRRYLS